MTSRFVPTFKAPSSDVVKKFIGKVAAIDRLLVLTGAGISTESDSGREISWRGQGTLKQSATLLISLSPRGTIREVCRLITQNVDGLHTKAGSTLLTELHGCGHRVRCMQCNEVTSREEHQLTLEKLNAEWMKVNVPGEIAPDGDVEIQEGAHESFVLAPCKKCGGILKTDVVFFGDNVIQSEVDKCYEKVYVCFFRCF
ncbi:hypothetical protein KIN20_014557 [Parelaphostrongylus tenuis]|uniref:Deacetylase sirtuin-type domain-containing protein n=1 Tax=Parelaphostrongylus tenuis TaxID=148309 RepID=A0AAD5QPH3_PARTN|nr:hypothetical protein KIN20_014557 [Parelaphostrongylus tenuis]